MLAPQFVAIKARANFYIAMPHAGRLFHYDLGSNDTNTANSTRMIQAKQAAPESIRKLPDNADME
jgi:hypothetical protein